MGGKEMIKKCECGCGEEVKKYKNRFINGHQNRGKNNPMYGKSFSMSEEAKKKISESQKGEGNSCWKGGRTIAGGGYVYIFCPDHPFSDINNRVKEERLVVEEYIGRYLEKKEIVHHINGNKSDNRMENLQIVSSKEHVRIHRKGIPRTIEVRKKISEGNKGKIVSEETKRKISESNKGISKNLGRKHTEKTKKKISLSHVGNKDSIETRNKKSESAKKAWKKRKRG
jgi:hypothetical protein